MQEDLNRILGTSKTTFKKIEEGFKAHVPQLTINQMGNLWDFYSNNSKVENIKAKRSGTGITIFVEIKK